MGWLRIINITTKQPNNSLLNRTWLDKRKASTTYFQTPNELASAQIKSKASPPVWIGGTICNRTHWTIPCYQVESYNEVFSEMKWLFNYWREAISSTPTHARLCLAQSQYLGGKEQQRGVEPIKQSVRQEIQFTKRKDGEMERERRREEWHLNCRCFCRTMFSIWHIFLFWVAWGRYYFLPTIHFPDWTYLGRGCLSDLIGLHKENIEQIKYAWPNMAPIALVQWAFTTPKYIKKHTLKNKLKKT